MKKRMRAAHLD